MSAPRGGRFHTPGTPIPARIRIVFPCANCPTSIGVEAFPGEFACACGAEYYMTPTEVHGHTGLLITLQRTPNALAGKSIRCGACGESAGVDGFPPIALFVHNLEILAAEIDGQRCSACRAALPTTVDPALAPNWHGLFR